MPQVCSTGALEIAEQIQNTGSIEKVEEKTEKPRPFFPGHQVQPSLEFVPPQ